MIWDYYIITQDESADDGETVRFLMNMGRDETQWQLCATRTLPDGRVRYYFKKPRT